MKKPRGYQSGGPVITNPSDEEVRKAIEGKSGGPASMFQRPIDRQRHQQMMRQARPSSSSGYKKGGKVTAKKTAPKRK